MRCSWSSPTGLLERRRRRAAQLQRDFTRADPVFTVRRAATLVDHVLIVGNIRTSEATIERESVRRATRRAEAISESQRRLSALGPSGASV